MDKKDLSTSPLVSILIPTRNNEKDLIDCLQSISNLNYDLKNLNIVIWDNNSSEPSKNRVKAFLAPFTGENPLEVNFVENDNNYGVYTSRDELLKKTGENSQLILSIDDDVLLPQNILNDLIPLFLEDSTTGIIGPRTVYDQAPKETAHGAGFVNRWLGQYTTKDTKKAVECDYVIGCCMLIKKEVIDKIGGFDRDYYTSHGEVDFCLRAKKNGYKVVYDPKVIVRHRVDRGGTRTPERMYYVYRNKLLVIKKNWPAPQKWIALFLYSLFWSPKAILDSLLVNRGVNWKEIALIIKAMCDGWLNRFGKRL